MKRLACRTARKGAVRLLVVPLLAVALGVMLSGCALPAFAGRGAVLQSPEADLLVATEAYATALEVLADCRRAGLIDAEQAAEIEQWRIVAAQALDAWREALETGEEPYDAVAAFNHAVRALWRAQLQAEGRGGDGAG